MNRASSSRLARLAVVLAHVAAPADLRAITLEPDVAADAALKPLLVELEHDRAACRAWSVHVADIAERMMRTGSLDEADGAAAVSAARGLEARCDGAEPRRASALLVLLLDHLNDEENQP